MERKDEALLRNFIRISSSKYGLLKRLADLRYNLGELDDTIAQITMDRYEMGEEFLCSAKAISGDSKVDRRNVISRSYYAMYHSARAVIFHTVLYDEDVHERLPERIHEILRGKYGQILRECRDIRNEADYSPYPEIDLAAASREMIASAEGFLRRCKEYLIERGVDIEDERRSESSISTGA